VLHALSAAGAVEMESPRDGLEDHVDGGLSRLIEAVNAPIFGVSVDGLVTEWNRKAAELSGYSKEEAMRHMLADEFITSNYKEQVRMILAGACEGRETSNFAFQMVTKAGKRVDVLLNTTARRDEVGVVTGVVGVGQDVTYLREASCVLGREAAERGTCETLVREAADMLQTVADTVAKAANAEGPFPFGRGGAATGGHARGGEGL
jgi:PAS domain S-box-containing protein